ncbi:MAG: DNA polymerase III subunits gamma and tau [uncultured Solirubrobacterales bacterium]|uniref:DNA polymerase III subunit gamma/tau n=1 Tax=uncultured Solirubrobacterales bacterium TaxID=768556 RepID=A0A6J4S180_9ACTN|nr:MAG: DNA polymerase III subunits gamma and tau [uncultured Solirubrobacterales bacterium]
MLSLYRRHRPRSFDDVVGQEHIVRTLRNAIELGKVHHAYLFVGSRGTGKTSMAKLLACALNAEGGPRADFAADDPNCRAIATGTSLDVVEMDAASNNSVDDIRELRENVALQPMGGASRVYILDEAHMLTTSAWNAFLKTLEEPPAHVVFVLATTEAHKVPATIVDRCHRFDFHRPSLEQLAGVLRRVAAEEEIEVPDAAVGMIARAATGSFRDALGTLEQLVTYGGNRVELADVLEVLGVADAELVLEAAESLADHDSKAALLCIDRLAASGRDLTQFIRDLAVHFRHLFVTQTLGEVPETFSVTAEHTDRIAAQADRISQGELLRAIDLLAGALGAVKDGSDARIQLELALTKAVRPDVDVSVGAMAFRLEQLEARVAELGGSARPPERGDAGAGRAPASAPDPAPAAPRPVAAEAPPSRHLDVSPVPVTSANGAGSPAPASEPPPPPSTAAAVLAAPAVAQPHPEAAPHPAEAPSPALDLSALRTLWPAVIDAIRAENAMVGALLGEARPTALGEEGLTVAFPPSAGFSKRKAEANRGMVQDNLRRLTGRGLTLRFELGEVPAESDLPSPAAPVLSEDELLERLKQEFGAREIFDDDTPARED